MSTSGIKYSMVTSQSNMAAGGLRLAII